MGLLGSPNVGHGGGFVVLLDLIELLNESLFYREFFYKSGFFTAELGLDFFYLLAPPVS